MLNWDDLKLVDAAARMRSLSAAAGAVGMSQPQLSRRLRGLEEEIGARLFDRTPKGLRPTAAGEKLIPLAARMRDTAESVTRLLPDLARDGLNVVRISCDEVRERLLTDHLTALTGQLGGVEIELHSSHAHADHARRGTEIQLRSCLPESDTLISRRLGSMAHSVYGARAYVETHPQAGNESRFTDCDWIGFAAEALWYPQEECWLSERLSTRPAFRVNTMTAMVDACAAGIGLAVVPCFMADRHPDLVRLMPPEQVFDTAEHLIVHRDVLREPAVRTVVDALAGLYRRAGAVMTGRAAQNDAA